MSIILTLTLLLIHFICDFILQTDAQAKGKSTSNLFLLEHVFCYAMTFGSAIALMKIMSGGFIDAYALGLFTVITFAAHFATDWVTSRINGYLWKQGDTHNFFVSVGFDQWLHAAQLLITYSLLFL